MSGPRLTLVTGGRDHGWTLGSVHLQLAPRESPPFDADLQFVEEDTYRVVAAGPEFREVEEHPVRLMTDLVEQQPLEPGSAFREKRNIILVIYDLDVEPICGPASIRTALRTALDLAASARATSVALPVPGRRHGRTALRTGVGLAVDAFRGLAPCSLRRALLHPEPQDLATVRDLLYERVGPAVADGAR